MSVLKLILVNTRLTFGLGCAVLLSAYLLPNSADAQSFEKWQNEVEVAYHTRNAESFVNFWCWEGIDPAKKKTRLEMQKKGLLGKIEKISFEEETPHFNEYYRKGKNYKSNQEIIGKLKLEVSGLKNVDGVMKMSFPVGLEDGKPCFTQNLVTSELSKDQLLDRHKFVITVVLWEPGEKVQGGAYDASCLFKQTDGKDKTREFANKHSVTEYGNKLKTCRFSIAKSNTEASILITKNGEKLFGRKLQTSAPNQVVNYP